MPLSSRTMGGKGAAISALAEGSGSCQVWSSNLPACQGQGMLGKVSVVRVAGAE